MTKIPLYFSNTDEMCLKRKLYSRDNLWIELLMKFGCNMLLVYTYI